MTRRSKLWRAAAALFTLVNVGGAGIAVAGGEGLHTAVHIGLLLLGAYVVWRLTPRAGWQDEPSVHAAGARLEHLQQSLDAIALEVERIGEAQRFTTKVLQERAEVHR